MHTVVETPAFLQSAREEGIGDDDRAAMVSHIAQHPDAGDLIPGTGGARKLREATGLSPSSLAMTFPSFCSTCSERDRRRTCRAPSGRN
jgi:hypothetical protein